MPTESVNNAAIADALDRLADRLAERDANPYRVQAYHTAAQTVRHTVRPLPDLLNAEGIEALQALPGIGESLALRIVGFIRTGRLRLLDDLQAGFSPRHLFTRVPGIGPGLAQRIYDVLGLDTLEALELAAHDGRLEQVAGFGRRRVRAVRAQLDALLGTHARRRARRFRRARPGRTAPALEESPVALLLRVDREYRYRSRRDELRRIAPRRFNPSGTAWLPVMETRRPPWRFTALFSNTARAHELEKTDDWVVLIAEREGQEQRYTVVTETRGDLQGHRVVRGREAECRLHYQARPAQAA